MKQILTLIPAFTLALSLFAQDFEGTIIYQNTYTSKTNGVTDQQLSEMLGTTQDYTIKGGDYKSTMNGNLIQWILNINKENKIYIKMSSSEAVLWNDASINKDEVINAQINKNTTDILGYKCDELVLTCKTGVQKYYFNSKLHVDPKLFEKHAFGNWYEFLKRTNALPLKMVSETEQFTLESIAISATPMTVDSKTLVLPGDVKTIKNPN